MLSDNIYVNVLFEYDNKNLLLNSSNSCFDKILFELNEDKYIRLLMNKILFGLFTDILVVEASDILILYTLFAELEQT